MVIKITLWVIWFNPNMRKISWYYKFFVFKLKKKINLDDLVFEKKNSLDLIFNHFGTDKGTQVKNPYSKKMKKNIGHGFGKFYEKYFQELKKKKFNFLEIGIWEGASLASFHCYFRNAVIHGIDRNFKNKYKSKFFSKKFNPWMPGTSQLITWPSIIWLKYLATASDDSASLI